MSERVKLLLTYNIRAGQENAYRRFILEEMLPKAQELGLTPSDAWHTAYGNYPNRLIGFVADDLETAQHALASEEWGGMMSRLQVFTGDVARRLVRLRGGFQW